MAVGVPATDQRQPLSVSTNTSCWFPMGYQEADASNSRAAPVVPISTLPGV